MNLPALLARSAESGRPVRVAMLGGDGPRAPKRGICPKPEKGLRHPGRGSPPPSLLLDDCPRCETTGRTEHRHSVAGVHCRSGMSARAAWVNIRVAGG